MALRSTIYNKIYPTNYPLWIKYLNRGSLIGLYVYPFVALATYARLGDPNFYQPTQTEYVLIYTYPLLLILITYCSYQLFKFNKGIAAILPIMVILYYCHLLHSGILFENPGAK